MGVYFIKAKGHTNGNSIVIVEKGGYIYVPAEHDGMAFEDLPDDWRCPRCKQPKEKFNKA